MPLNNETKRNQASLSNEYGLVFLSGEKFVPGSLVNPKNKRLPFLSRQNVQILMKTKHSVHMMVLLCLH